MSEKRLTLTVEEAAEALGISRASAYQACRSGELRAVRLGRCLIVPRQAIDELLGSSRYQQRKPPEVVRACARD